MVICESVSSPSAKKDFLQAMRGIAATVTVISSKKGSNQQAMTATSVTSLSLEPPSMLVCVNQEASIYAVLEKGLGFCVNVLTTEQVGMAEICSNKGKEDERFSVGNWSILKETPYLLDAQSNIFCKCIDLLTYETHTIFLGEVKKVINQKVSNPLLYKDGRYLD